ncbi:hypothetical protein YC2023_064629 [Brassica napus]
MNDGSDKEDMRSSEVVAEDRGSSVVVTGPVDVLADPAIMKIGPEIGPTKEVVSDTSLVSKEVVSSETVVSETVTEQIEELGRGQRVKIPSVKLADYVTYKTLEISTDISVEPYRQLVVSIYEDVQPLNQYTEIFIIT